MIEIVTSALMLMSVFYGGQSPEAKASETGPLKEKTTEEIVREYFSDVPMLAEVARCESTFRHFDKNGKVIRGLHNEYDVGVMQINELYHAEDAKKFGYDIYTLEGNMAFARRLFEKQGLAPWKASSKCWREHATVATNA